MNISLAIFGAAMDVMKWLFAVTAGLLVILTVTQYFRGDEGARPALTLSLAAGFLVLAIGSRWVALRVGQALRDGE
jgi:zinc transporter ZupT